MAENRLQLARRGPFNGLDNGIDADNELVNPRFNSGRDILSGQMLRGRRRFADGPKGLIEKDPVSALKGVGIAPFTAAPDILGLVQQGSNALGNVVQRALGLPEVGFQPISGDPIRESIGLDPQSPQGLAGEVVSPVGTIAKGLGIAAKSVVAGAKLAANTQFPAELAMVLFHGSPFKFNKFSLDKIGTGEGAQAFGHGLYFAENPSVAQGYQSALSRTANTGNPSQDLANFALSAKRGDAQRAKKLLEDDLASFARQGRPTEEFSEYSDAIRILEEGKAESAGNLYEVEIPDSVTNRMLDWDARLSDLPNRLKNVLLDVADQVPTTTSRFGGGGSPERLRLQFELDGAMPEDYYRILTDAYGSPEQASKALREAGIPGIRYFDGGSRAGQEGTRNIVVFNPDDITQVKRDGEKVFNKL